ncbi:hypothetical protein ACLQ26_02570 [Micromonospora sp. DT43]|uniref:hypothetical protein n=1 Tax=Micromonospora sp. DT43 TaxID=3393440 RepID=UPI003CEC9F76
MPRPTDGVDAEEPLSGGFVADVVRIGDTVRRTPPVNLDFVGALLRHLAEVGADLAPRHLGVDDRGRQVLSYVAGRVPWRNSEDRRFFADPALADHRRRRRPRRAGHAPAPRRGRGRRRTPVARLAARPPRRRGGGVERVTVLAGATGPASAMTQGHTYSSES